MLHYRPGDRDAVVGAGPAPYLIEHQQAAGRRMVEKVGGFDHFDHEGGLPGANLVPGADAGKDAVHQADVGLISRHKGADLGHQDDEGHLAQKGALARHVGASDDQDHLLVVKADVVGHKGLLALRDLDHGVPTGDDVQFPALRKLGPDVAVQQGDLGQGGADVEGGQRAGYRQEALRGGSHLLHNLLIDNGFQIGQAFLGIENEGFVLF